MPTEPPPFLTDEAGFSTTQAPPTLASRSTSDPVVDQRGLHIGGTAHPQAPPPLTSRSTSDPVVDQRGLRIGGTEKGLPGMVSRVLFDMDKHIPYPNARDVHKTKRKKTPIDGQFVVGTSLLADVTELTEGHGIKLDEKTIAKNKKKRKEVEFQNKACSEYDANRLSCDINQDGFRRRASHTKPNDPPPRKKAPPKARAPRKTPAKKQTPKKPAGKKNNDPDTIDLTGNQSCTAGKKPAGKKKNDPEPQPPPPQPTATIDLCGKQSCTAGKKTNDPTKKKYRKRAAVTQRKRATVP